MKRIAIAAAAGLALAAGSAPFEAPSAESLLIAGQKLKAAQFCHRHKGHKGEGVTLYLRSVSENGTRADVGVAIACWCDAACTTQDCSQHTFKGSLTIQGGGAEPDLHETLN